MTTFTLRKGELKNEDKRFTGINTEALGVAAGKLSVAGLRLYLYLAGHKDGIQWTVNPSVYADWLGIDYSTKGRTVRKTLNDGISNLIDKKYLKLVDVDIEQYEFWIHGLPMEKD